MVSTRLMPRIASAVLATGLTLSSPTWAEQQRERAPTDSAASQQAPQLASVDPQVGTLESIERSLKAIAVDVHSTPRDELEALRERERREREVDDNGRAASWAGWMVIVGLLQLVLGVAGTWLIWETLKATRAAVKEANDATEAARSAIQVTERGMRLELRAYVGIDSANVIDFGPSKVFEAQVVLRNAGSTPAKQFRTVFKVGLVNWPLADLPDLGEIDGSSGRELLPGATTKISNQFVSALTPDQFRAVRAGQLAIVFYGKCAYEDVFGKPQTIDIRLIYGGEAGANIEGFMYTDAIGNSST